MAWIDIEEGDGPVLLACPHAGTELPDGVAAKLNGRGSELIDTDWRIDALYDGLLASASRVTARFHRYVIDANRDPSGESLYPGQNTTGLVPVTDFDGAPIWRDDALPDADEIEARRSEFHAPYHDAVAAQIARIKSRWGCAIVYDCHSIRSEILFLFDGRLPDFNIGTNEGATCVPEIERAVAEACGQAEGFTSVVNGRFKGGWTTRHYGRPEGGVHAIQMELSQRTYLESEEAPFAFDAAKADIVRQPLRAALEALDAIGRSGALSARTH